MTTSLELEMAILSMDAYNQPLNGDPGIGNLNDATIGNATFISPSDPNVEMTTGFYAAAYSWSGQTIISYRGTVSSNALGTLGADILNGWTLGAGYAAASQAQEAIQFYNQVNGNASTLSGNSNIILTGHSLGGGLAGFVGDLTGNSAYIYNNEPFGGGVVAESMYNLVAAGLSLSSLSQALPTSSSANINQIITAGEFLTYVRAVAPAVYNAILGSAAGALGTYYDTSTNSTTLAPFAGSFANATNLHSIALEVLEIYASDNFLTAWSNIGTYLYHAEFIAGDLIAGAAGITSNRGYYSPGATLLSEIAYSAADGGSPFGSTAIMSYFHDADLLGSLVAAKSLPGVAGNSSAISALTEILVQYAGDEAATAGGNSNSVGIFSIINNILSNFSNILDVTLGAQNFANTTNDGSGQVVGAKDFAEAMLANTGLGQGSMAFAGACRKFPPRSQNALGPFEVHALLTI